MRWAANYSQWGEIRIKGCFFGDLVKEKGSFDLGEANVFSCPNTFFAQFQNNTNIYVGLHCSF